MLKLKIAVLALTLFGITAKGQEKEVNLAQQQQDVENVIGGFVFIDGQYIESPYRVTVNKG